MLGSFAKKIFGSSNDRFVRGLARQVEAINALEPALQKLSDEELRAKTDEFKKRVAGGEALEDLLPEAFAVVREGSKRVMKMRHFDVQMLGGMSLHNCMLPHGPDKTAFEGASNVELAPEKLRETMSFMFETRFPQHLTLFAAQAGHLQEDYIDCWASLEKKFDGTPGLK